MVRERVGMYEKVKDKRVKYKNNGRCIDCGAESERCRCEKCRTARAAHMRTWRAKNIEHSREMQKKWRMAHPDRDKEKQTVYRVKKKYGIDIEEYREIISHPCGICGRTEKAIVMDHCHKTNKIRGGLCVRCNGLLGWYEEYRNKIETWVDIGGKK